MNRAYVLREIKKYRWNSPHALDTRHDITTSNPQYWKHLLNSNWWSRGMVVAHGRSWVWHNIEDKADPVPWLLEAVHEQQK